MLPLLLCLFAQDLDLPETDTTPPRSEATCTATSARATVVSGEDLLRTGRRSLPEMIGEATGLWVQETNLGGGSPAIRGLMGNHILILVDGVRLNDSSTRVGPNQSLNNLDPYIVDRVEVVRGPASVLYGSDAIGGVILIYTKRRPAGSQDFESYLYPIQGGAAGSYDSSVRGGSGSVNLSGAIEDHALLGIGSFHNFANLRVGENEDYPFTGYQGQSLFGAYELAVGDRKTLRATARYNVDYDVPRTDKMVPGYGQTEPDYTQYSYSLQDRRGYLLAYLDDKPGKVVDRLQIRASVNGYREKRSKVQANDPDQGQTFEQDDVTSAGLGIDWQKALSDNHRLTWGLDLLYDDIDSSRRYIYSDGTQEDRPGAYAPDSRSANGGLFVQDEILALDPWLLTVGLRYSYCDYSFQESDSGMKQSGDFDALTASVEGAREVSDGVTLTATLAQAYRAPNLNDLANDGTFSGGTELHNPDLEPERSLGAEVAVDVQQDEWGGTLALFATRIEDYIGRYLLDPGSGEPGDEIYQRANTGRVELYGTELKVRRQLMEADSPFAISARLDYTYGSQDDSSSGYGTVPARRVPPLFGQIALHFDPVESFHRLDWATLSMDWALRQDRLHPQDLSDPRIDPAGTPSWTTFNFSFGGDIDNDSDWWIGVYNLTDAYYRVHSSGLEAPGLRVVLGLQFKI